MICSLSRSLDKVEKKYTATEREYLALVRALEKHSPYLEGSPFIGFTYYYSLLWSSNLNDTAGALCGWAVRLQQVVYKLVYRKGKDNAIPECLSRGLEMVARLVVNCPMAM